MLQEFSFLFRAVATVATFVYFAILYIVEILIWDVLSAQKNVQNYCKQILSVAGQEMICEGDIPVTDDRPVIYAPTHGSWFDTLIMGAWLNGRFTAAVAKGYFYIPVIGQIFRLQDCIAIDRSNPETARASLAEEGAERLGRMISLIIFPGGRRSPDGFLDKFKMGAFHLAVRNGVEIVPVLIDGSNQALGPIDWWRIRKGKIVVRFGKPLSPEGLTAQQLAEETRLALISLGAKERPQEV